MELLTPRLILRQISSIDLNDIHYLHSLPEVDEYNTLGLPENIEETRKLLFQWLDMQKQTPRISYIFCMLAADTKEFIGLIALNLGKASYRNAEVWYKILPAAWGKGYTTEALNTLLKFGFCSLGLHRIEAGCAVENIASVRVLEKAGMVREGSKRKILPIRGQWVDNYFYSILDTDKNWQERL